MEHFDIAIIGTGSGNSILDERYTDKRVAICEQGTFGGTCLNVGCIPTKMFVYAAEVAQTIRDSKRFGVDATLDGVRWSDIVSRVFGRIDPIAMGGENYRRSSPNVTVYDTHTRFTEPTADGRYTAAHRGRRGVHRRPGGDRGGLARARCPTRSGTAASTTTPATPSCGSVNCQSISSSSAADSSPPSSPTPSRRWARGSRSSSAAARCCKHCDDTVCERFTDIASKKWEIHNHCNVVGASQDSNGITLTMDNGATLQADTVLVATGRIPNGDLLDAELAGIEVRDGSVVVDEYQRTTARGVFALGDVSSDYQLKHVANHESASVRENLLLDWDDTDSLKQSDHRYVPSAVFTDPQIAMVGLTENQARAKGYDVSLEGAGLRRRRLRLGDGGHHRHREDHRGRRLGKDPRRTHHGPSGLIADPAASSRR